MPQGPVITEEVRMLAAKLHRDHPKWTNAMVREEIRDIVHKRDKSLPKDWPSKYAIDRIMPEIRKKYELEKTNPNPLDKPWTIRSMAYPEYSIPAEALPAVLRLWYFFFDRFHVSLTIRQALWAARLYAAVTNTENLAFHVLFSANVDILAEQAGITNFMAGQADNIHIYSTITGHEITREEDMRIFRMMGVTDEMLQHMKRVIDKDDRGHSLLDGAEFPDSGIRYERPTLLSGTESTEEEFTEPEVHDEGSDLL